MNKNKKNDDCHNETAVRSLFMVSVTGRRLGMRTLQEALSILKTILGDSEDNITGCTWYSRTRMKCDHPECHKNKTCPLFLGSELLRRLGMVK